jgi:uncharacterized protein (DUF983 family)
MPTFACPRCGSPVSLRRAFNIGNKPFCSCCGWNLERAEAALTAKSAFATFFPLAIAALVFFFLVFTTAKSSNNPALFLVPVLFLAIGLIPIVGYYSAKKAIAVAKFSVNPDLALAQPSLDPALQLLQSQPRPRRVSIRFQGSLFLPLAVLTFIGMVMFITVSNPSHSPSSKGNNGFAPFFPLLFMGAFLVIAFVVPVFRETRNRPLLRDGELAFARVVSQRTVQQGKSSHSSIDYEFKTNSGLQIRSTARDLTNSVFEDMTIPVFFNPGNPDKNITLCATYLKVSTDPL